MKTKYYVVYGLSTGFFADYDEVEYPEFPTDIKPKRYAFGYRIHHIIETTIDGVVLTSDPIYDGGWNYWGEIITKESATGVLLENMKSNGWDTAVKTITGATYPLGPGDNVIQVA